MKVKVSILIGGFVTVASLAGCGDGPTPPPGSTGGTDTMTVTVLLGTAVDTVLAPGQTARYEFQPAAVHFSPDSTVFDPDQTLYFAAFGRTAATQAERRTVTIDVFDHQLNPVARVTAVGSDLDLTTRGTGRVAIKVGEKFRIQVRSQDHDGRVTLLLARLRDLPEGTPPELRIGQPITEAVTPPGDIDRYKLLDVPAGQLVNLVVDALDSAGTPLLARFGSATTNLRRADSDPRADRWVTDAFRPGGVSGVWLSLEGATDTVSPGRYRILMQQIDVNPEDVSAVTFGDTLVESIGIPGDIDEFAIDSPDHYAMVFLDGASFGDAGLKLSMVNSVDQPVFGYPIVVGPMDSTVWKKGAQRVVPRQLRLRVQGTDTRDTGSYRLVVRGVDPAPETAAAALVFGDTVLETMDLPGDVDEFQLPSHVGWLVVVVRTLSGGAPDSLTIDVGSVEAESRNGVFASTGTFATNTANPLTVRVNGRGARYSTTSAPYELVAYDVHPSPEANPVVLTVGDSLLEPLEPAGDFDFYRIATDSGRVVQFRSQTDVPGGLVAEIQRTIFGGYWLIEPGAVRSSFGFRVGAADTFSVFIRDVRSGRNALASGSYTWVVSEIGTAPEAFPAVITPGDTVVGEPYDPGGDVDEFIFHAAAGERYTARWTALGPVAASWELPVLTVRDSGMSRFVSPVTYSSPWRTTWSVPFLALADEWDLVTVTRCEVCEGSYVGPYELRLERINPAPERVSSTYVPGDTIGAEALDYGGDIDEFTFPAVAGDSFALWLTSGSIEDTGAVRVRLLETGSGAVLYDRAEVIEETGATISRGPLAIANTGQHTLKIESVNGGRFEPALLVAGYESVAYHVNSGPEVADPDIQVGDSVTTEAIDRYHDVDTFSLHGTAGDSVVMFLDRLGPPSSENLWVGAYDGTQLIGSVFSTSSPTSFQLPGSGTARIVVSAADNVGRYVGPYRLAFAKR